MSNRGSAGLRARDIDRSATATLLDNAYSEGQLSFEEHHSRITRARAAVTLRDLDTLVADLQVRAAMPRPVVAPDAPRFSGRALTRWGAAVVGLLALGAVVWFTARTEPAEEATVTAAETATATPAATTTPAPPGEVQPIYAPSVDFATAAGFAEFVTLYRERFGDTIADDLSVYPDDNRAYFSRMEEVDRTRAYNFSGGFDPLDLAAREANEQVIDISTISADGFATVQQAALTQSGFRDATVSHISMRLGRTGPEMLVYVGNEVGEHAYFTAAFDGRILSRN